MSFGYRVPSPETAEERARREQYRVEQERIMAAARADLDAALAREHYHVTAYREMVEWDEHGKVSRPGKVLALADFVLLSDAKAAQARILDGGMIPDVQVCFGATCMPVEEEDDDAV